MHALNKAASKLIFFSHHSNHIAAILRYIYSPDQCLSAQNQQQQKQQQNKMKAAGENEGIHFQLKISTQETLSAQ